MICFGKSCWVAGHRAWNSVVQNQCSLSIGSCGTVRTFLISKVNSTTSPIFVISGKNFDLLRLTTRAVTECIAFKATVVV